MERKTRSQLWILSSGSACTAKRGQRGVLGPGSLLKALEPIRREEINEKKTLAKKRNVEGGNSEGVL